MATAKPNKKMSATLAQVPECPVCLDMMTAPIFQCKTGHSLCSTCTSNLRPPHCPICRQDMTQMRNLTLEDLVAKAKVNCPNKSDGCVYTMLTGDVEDHLKECIFRKMDCPLGLVMGKCSWNGELKEMMQHFKERHAAHCNVSSDADVELNINVKEDDRFVFLTSQGKLLFIITMKLDTLQKMAYWAIQHIGSKKGAQQHVYEIHITSRKDNRRKVVFTEHCFNDAIKADDVFRMSKCGMMPLDAVENFVKDRKLAFRFFIKKSGPPPPKNKENNPNNKPSDNKPNKPGGNKPNKPGNKGPPPQNGQGPKAQKCK